MNILINLFCSGFMAWLAYAVVDELNKRDAKLELDPVIHACIAFFFGLVGMCFSAGYIAVKSYKLNK